MTRNVGPEDRVVRIVAALALCAIVYFANLPRTADVVIGLVAAYLLLTGLFTYCLVYKLTGIDTSVQEQPYSTTDDRAGF